MEEMIAIVREFSARSNSVCSFLNRPRITSGLEPTILSVLSDGAKRVVERIDCESEVLGGCRGTDDKRAARSAT